MRNKSGVIGRTLAALGLSVLAAYSAGPSGQVAARAGTESRSKAYATLTVKPTVHRFVQISADNENGLGYDFSCGLTSGQRVMCWGSNANGAARPPHVRLAAVSAGLSFACGLGAAGAVVCWGNTSGGSTAGPNKG